MNPSFLIDVGRLRVGMYIQLELGWMNHPFPVSSFRISSGEQIGTLQSLGLQQVRWVPSRSDPGVQDAVRAEDSPVAATRHASDDALQVAAGTAAPSAAMRATQSASGRTG